jgi:hypothetical protein
MAKVEQAFERSRLSEEVLASAYERLLPLICRSTRLPQEPTQPCLVERQPRSGTDRRYIGRLRWIASEGFHGEVEKPLLLAES